MPQWIDKETLQKVCDMFESDKDIWTQPDIVEATGLTQPAVSEAMRVLEIQGILCWVRNEGMKQVKFYSKVSDKIPKLTRRKLIPIAFEYEEVEVS